MRLQFGLEAYQHRASALGAQRLINCYLEKTPDESDNPIALVGSYGLGDFATPGSGPLRGGRQINGVTYVVSGTTLYQVASDGTATSLGTIAGADRVSIAGDGTNVAVLSAGTLYVWDGATLSTVVTPATFEALDFLSPYFVGISGGLVYVSAAQDPTSWSALDFIDAEASPDDIVGIIVEKGELFCGGKDSLQSFVVTQEQVPLNRVAEGIAEIGLLSRYGFGKIDNTIFFPATDFTVRALEGYLPHVISTPAISQAIEDLTATEKGQLYGMCWAEGGHSMYGLTSPQWTFVFDAMTRKWHQRRSDGYSYWRPLFALNAFNRVLIGDSITNKLGELSPAAYDEWGEALIMVGTCNVAGADYANVFAPGLELVFQRGVGLTTGQGSAPMVMMRQSFDGGKTWTTERARPMGAIGEYETRAYWSRMGRARSRIIEFSISDPVQRALSYAKFVDPEVGER